MSRRSLAWLALAATAFAAAPARAQSVDGAPAPKAEPAAAAPPAQIEGAPEGAAAPPTAAATHGDGPLRVGLDVIADHTYRNVVPLGGRATYTHAFDVPRAHGALDGTWDVARARVLIEATRSNAQGALVGVAGDSLILRVREAFVAATPWEPLTLSLGAIPTAMAPELDGTWIMPAVAPSALELSGLGAPADLGAKARAELPRGLGWVSVAAMNGEGYASRDLNRGKSVEVAAAVRPLATAAPALAAFRPVTVTAGYVAGSAGTASARAERLTAGLLYQGRWVRAGATFTYAWGVGSVGTQHANLLSAFLRVEPLPRVFFGARLDHFVRDARATPADRLTTAWLAGGVRLADPLETFMAVSRSLPTQRYDPDRPGENAWTMRLIGRVSY